MGWDGMELSDCLVYYGEGLVESFIMKRSLERRVETMKLVMLKWDAHFGIEELVLAFKHLSSVNAILHIGQMAHRSLLLHYGKHSTHCICQDHLNLTASFIHILYITINMFP